MDISVKSLGPGAAVITRGRGVSLAASTDLTGRIFKQITLKELLKKPGYVFSGSEYSPWECTESIEHEGRLLFPGQYYPGESLASHGMEAGTLLKLARSFTGIVSNGLFDKPFFTKTVFVTENGDILYFPPELSAFIASNLTDEDSMEYMQPYNHPDAKDETALCFTLGVLAYRLFSGFLPFKGGTPTEVREKMRKSRAADIKLINPEIPEDLAGIINKSLRLEDVSLKEWEQKLTEWIAENGNSPYTPSGLNTAAEKEIARIEKRFSANSFLQRNWKIIALSAAALIIAGMFLAQPLRIALQPPATAGMTPGEVVDSYYTGIMTLNPDIMEDCTAKGAGKDDIRDITSLFVFGKVRTGYEGKSGIISAEDWKEGKVTEIGPDEQVYGITDLDIKQTGENMFVAEYTKWIPDIPEDPDSREKLPPLQLDTEDTLTLSFNGKVWEIIKIERKIRE